MKAKILIVGILLVLYSCNNDDTKQNCGCNSETIETVPNVEWYPEVSVDEQTSGLLFYKRSENIDYVFDDEHDGQYNNRFWIFQGTEGCHNCQRNFKICNEELLGTDYDYLKNSNDSIPIKFTGNAKHLCIEPFIAPADFFYAEIKLNSIKQQ